MRYANADNPLRFRIALQRQGAHGGGLCGDCGRRQDRRHQCQAAGADGRQSARQGAGAVDRRRRGDLRQPGDHAISQPPLGRGAVSAQRGQADRCRKAGGAGRRHLRLPAGACLRAPLAARGNGPPALARQAVGQGRQRARPSQRGDAETAARSPMPGISRCAPRSATSICASPENGNAAMPS